MSSMIKMGKIQEGEGFSGGEMMNLFLNKTLLSIPCHLGSIHLETKHTGLATEILYIA